VHFGSFQGRETTQSARNDPNFASRFGFETGPAGRRGSATRKRGMEVQARERYGRPGVTALVFDRHFSAVPGVVDVLGPDLRRVLAPNPGPFTFHGTGTYIVGRGEVAIIDPGPADERHLDAIEAALAGSGERITHVVITHTHADHSPGARLLADRTGATIVGCAPHPDDGDSDDDVSLDSDPVQPVGSDKPSSESDQQKESGQQKESDHQKESVDRDYRPDWEMHDGDVVEGATWRLEAVHTPGHISNHLCFAWLDRSILFSGDHVMRWSTSVISPPTGDLRAYLASIHRVLARPEQTYWPTHGPAVTDPADYLPALLAHRAERTRQIVEVLRIAPSTVPGLVKQCYPGLDERLVKAAGRSVLAHLYALRDDGRVTSVSDAQLPRTWSLTNA
jgi:glyoxylase-like metal-dependent hydrolase (beta-lactamase superfamily II)